MSIEALIQAHTEALLANTEAVKLLTLSLAGRTPVKETKVEKAEKVKKEEISMSEIDTRDLSTPIEELVKEEKADAVPYETVRALVLKLAPTQRDAIKALNAKHGIANLKVLLDKEDDFSTVNDQAKLEAVYADLQALEG
ncbi:hypothetical protein D3C84_101520 [compost metagenome]